MIPPILKQDIKQNTISELTLSELQSLKDAILSLQVLDVDNVHPTFLPWLAWWFRAEDWDANLSVSHQRRIVKSALILYKYKGTQWAIIHAISLLDFKSSILEWHEQASLAPNGTFKVFIDTEDKEHVIDSHMQKKIANAIERNKRGSQHWSIDYETNSVANINIGSYTTSISEITIGPPIPKYTNNMYISSYSIIDLHVTIGPKLDDLPIINNEF